MRLTKRSRTRNIEHINKRVQRENLTLYYECVPLLISEDSWEDIYDPVITNSLRDPFPTPEEAIISKDILESFSKEAKELTKIILSCPEEFFMTNGKIIQELLQGVCKEQLGWNRNKTKKVTNEMGSYLKQACA